MTSFNFIDDDPRTGARARARNKLITEFADALRANPGRWAEYPYPSSTSTAASGAVCRINRGHKGCKALRAKEFQAAMRDGVVYVRYVEAIV